MSNLRSASPPLVAAERRLAFILRVLAAVFFGGVAMYLIPALIPSLQDLFLHLPFVTNSVVKIGTLGMLAFIASADVRKFRPLVTVIIAAHFVSMGAVAVVLLLGDASRPVPLGGATAPVAWLLWASIALDAPITALLIWAAGRAERQRRNLQYLSPAEYRTAVALADAVVVGADEVVPPAAVAGNVDRYLGMMRARSKWIAKVALRALEYYPLLSFRPPLSLMRAGDRLEFLRARFYQDVAMRLTPPFWRTLVQAMIRFGKQLAYLGYYNDPRAFAQVNYLPFSARVPPGKTADQWQRELAERRQAGRLPLQVLTPREVNGERRRGDVVIVGSGAGAAVLAHQLTRRGHNVLMLERGQYSDRTTFTEDEAEMLTRLYADGALQLSRDFRFQVIQGACVGGSTVVNNGVCFDLPAPVLDHWNRTLGAGLDEARLRQSFAAVRAMLSVNRQSDLAVLNQGYVPFDRGARALGLARDPREYGPVEANITGCLGCGYCNIGCQFGAKLSMLDCVLPRAQTHAQNGGGRLEILAECEAVRLLGTGRRIKGVRCRLGDGRVIDVDAGAVVLSAGAVASSLLLLRSAAGGSNVGQRLCFNIGSPLTAVFPGKIDSYRGLQISHFFAPQPAASFGYVLETWWNPPAAQALAMPGWFEDHYRNMQRYDRMAGVGVLVGSGSNGRVRKSALGGGAVIDFVPTRADLDRLLGGLMRVGEIFLAGGAETILPHTFQYHELKTGEEVRRLPELVRDASDLTLGTGHPQGGNALSRDPRGGVVDEGFRVHDHDNLFVCDASVFPSAVGVNPQLTVMALAHYAAEPIGDRIRASATA